MNKPFGPPSEMIQAEAIALPPVFSLERRRLRFYIVMLWGDFAAILFCFTLAGLLYEGSWWNTRAAVQGQLLLPIFFTIALYSRAYSSKVLTDWRLAIRKTWTALVVAALLLNFVAFYTKSNAEFSRGSFTLGLAFCLVALGASRWLGTRLVARFWGGQVSNQLILDDGGPSFALHGAVRICTKSNGLSPIADDPHMFDRLGQLLLNQDRVVVLCQKGCRAQWAFMLKSFGVRGEIISEPVHAMGATGVIRYEDQRCTALVVSNGPLSLQSRAIKRGFDIAVASAALVALAPVFAMAAARIKLGDGGPVLFVQRRLGRGNRFFKMLKFRTMSASASDGDGGLSTGRDDRRVTRIGRRLRANSMDELPQLWNVLRGDMSIVGPRPHAIGSKANDKLFWEVDSQYWQRHSLRPGMTGLAQVRGFRGATDREEDLTQRLQSDLEYIQGWSLLRDIVITWRTLLVLRHDNAY